MVRFVGKYKNLACHLETQGDYILSPLPNLLAPQDKLNLFQYSDPSILPAEAHWSPVTGSSRAASLLSS